MMLRAARVMAWLEGRESLVPEDIHAVFRETVSHRISLTPFYELRRTELSHALTAGILDRVAAP